MNRGGPVRQSHRTILFAAALLIGATGAADATDGKGPTPSTGARKDDGASTTSVGAGGLTGTGAVKDGARTGDGQARTGDAKPSSAPAAGITR
ncbi:MAG: hypothetical protein INR63_27370 [Actinomycetospora chiangmaiensis]|nr:hypothetical protein [Actinomycetospora chiangmaiensis]